MRAIVLPALLAAAVAALPAAAEDVSPVPTSMPEGSVAAPVPTGSASSPATAPADTGVIRTALSGIGYRDCGKGGPGKLLVTFHNDGTVERVVLAEGTWEPNVALCVTRRFMEAKIPAFAGTSRTVKFSVALDGGAPTTATYAAPFAHDPPPSYRPYPKNNYFPVLPADDGPPPAGYHLEERSRPGSLVTGAVMSSLGLLFTVLALGESDGHRNWDGPMYTLLALGHLGVGVPLFCVGLTKRKVFVLDSATVSIAPVITRSSASLGLTFGF